MLPPHWASQPPAFVLKSANNANMSAENRCMKPLKKRNHESSNTTLQNKNKDWTPDWGIGGSYSALTTSVATAFTAATIALLMSVDGVILFDATAVQVAYLLESLAVNMAQRSPKTSAMSATCSSTTTLAGTHSKSPSETVPTKRSCSRR